MKEYWLTVDSEVVGPSDTVWYLDVMTDTVRSMLSNLVMPEMRRRCYSSSKNTPKNYKYVADPSICYSKEEPMYNQRVCLRCEHLFDSTKAGNRICKPCALINKKMCASWLTVDGESVSPSDTVCWRCKQTNVIHYGRADSVKNQYRCHCYVDDSEIPDVTIQIADRLVNLNAYVYWRDPVDNVIWVEWVGEVTDPSICYSKEELVTYV